MTATLEVTLPMMLRRPPSIPAFSSACDVSSGPSAFTRKQSSMSSADTLWRSL